MRNLAKPNYLPLRGALELGASAALSRLANQGFSSTLPLRQNKKTPVLPGFFYSGGEGGIRTLDKC